MKTITLKTAKAIAADWHGGQGTALYSFASTGNIDAGAGDHLAEIGTSLRNSGICREEINHLEKLKRFINVKINNHERPTE